MAKTDDITRLLTPLLDDLGYELVGLEYHPHPSNAVLRVYIDQPERGVNVDDCARVSREVSGLLDVHDPIAGRYQLEVSSPGLDRPLFTPEQFRRFMGDEVKVTAASPVAGRRKFRGQITDVIEDRIVLTVEGEALEIEHANIVKARLVPQF